MGIASVLHYKLIFIMNKSKQTLLFIYTQSYMHHMRMEWSIDTYIPIYYRNQNGLIPFAKMIYKHNQYYLKIKEEKVFNEQMVIKYNGELIHLLMFADCLESKVYDYQNEISIGRGESNLIKINHPYISSLHARLTMNEDVIEIEDVGSLNGVYVNDRRIHKQKVVNGDIIHIPYLYIMIHHQCLIIAYLKGSIKVSLKPYIQNQQLMNKQHFIHIQKEPIIHSKLDVLTIDIQSPPQHQNTQKPLWMMLLPAMTMGLSTSMMMLTALQNDSLLSRISAMTMSGSMLCSTVLLPLIVYRYEKLQEQQKIDDIDRAYTQYYQEKEIEIHNKAETYLKLYEQSQVSTQEAMKRIVSLKKIWQKDVNSEDALVLVLGEVTAKLPWQVEYAPLAIKNNYSKLEQRYQQLLKELKEPYQLSYHFNLRKERLLGIYGLEGIGYALQMLLQLCVTHDNRSLHIWVCAEESSFYQWGIMYLPHIFQKDGTRRLISTKEDFTSFQHYLRVKTDAALEVLVLIHDKLETLIAVDELLSEYPFLSIVQVAPTHQQLSTTCVHTIHVGKNHDITLFQQNPIQLKYTYYELEKIKKAMHQLSYIRWKKDQFKNKTFGFLDLYLCQEIEQLQIKERWQQKKKMNVLNVPIGYDQYQEKIILNVHETCHGPHGVIAGMTGSGKSEFLVTFILSLCIQYSSEEVSFLLIDYKGGMSASAFQELPHISYVMTNLNDHSIHRVSISLQAELNRRQQLFKFYAQKYQTGVMDIDKYWQLVLTKDAKPLPHLFIIADEFAELKSSQEEFLKLLKKISRIGRSLGIHLILSTQKPSGVIDDEILSNSRFRVCLKVAYTQDSNEVLKHEDAAYLKEPGSFYLQVGNDEIYIQGRCSYTQTPYHKKDDIQSKNICFHRYHGKTYLSKQLCSPSPSITQLQALVAYMSHLSKELHLPSFQFCNPELHFKQQTTFHFHPMLYLGELDDVQSQCRHPFYFSTTGNHLIFGKKGSGTSEFLRTIIYEYSRCCPDTCIYIITATDAFNDLKQYEIVGDVINVYHQEAYESFFYQLQHRFYHKKIVIIISLYERILECQDCFQNDFKLLRNHATQLIVSGYSSLSLPYRWTPYFEHRHLLQMEDKSEYKMIQNGDSISPQKQIGSGITLYQNRPMLFQIYPYEDKLVAQLKKGISEERIPLLPKDIPMLFRRNAFYLGKDLYSKEDIFVATNQKIVICAQYDIPSIFYRYVEAYEAKYQQKLDISFYDFNQWKSYQYDEAFQKEIRNASFIFVGDGLMECLYALPLPSTIHYDLKRNQLVCYVSQKLHYVAMMEEEQ